MAQSDVITTEFQRLSMYLKFRGALIASMNVNTIDTVSLRMFDGLNSEKKLAT